VVCSLGKVVATSQKFFIIDIAVFCKIQLVFPLTTARWLQPFTLTAGIYGTLIAVE